MTAPTLNAGATKGGRARPSEPFLDGQRLAEKHLERGVDRLGLLFVRQEPAVGEGDQARVAGETKELVGVRARADRRRLLSPQHFERDGQDGRSRATSQLSRPPASAAGT